MHHGLKCAQELSVDWQAIKIAGLQESLLHKFHKDGGILASLWVEIFVGANLPVYLL